MKVFGSKQHNPVVRSPEGVKGKRIPYYAKRAAQCIYLCIIRPDRDQYSGVR
jgi:hypothetical protein